MRFSSATIATMSSGAGSLTCMLAYEVAFFRLCRCNPLGLHLATIATTNSGAMRWAGDNRDNEQRSRESDHLCIESDHIWKNSG